MKIYFSALAVLFLVSFTSVHAQTIKTDVLVAGGGAVGAGAGIQAAHSGVKALLLVESPQPGNEISTIDSGNNLGLNAEIILHSRKNPEKSISEIVKSWTDTVKNLTVITGAKIKSVKKSGNRWVVKLDNGKKIKALFLVGSDASLLTNAGLSNKADTRISAGEFTSRNLYSNKLYRTSVPVSATGNTLNTAPLGSLIPNGSENFILLPSGDSGSSAGLIAGQSAGAAAAYCAFFKTNTNNINVRVVQGELLNYKSELIHLSDVNSADSNYAAIQHIAATGILKGVSANGSLSFMPGKTVTVEEVREPVKEYYSRSQIWFADHITGELTLDDVLSLIRFSGNRGNELNREVEKAWRSSFMFNTSFDLKRPVTRREFAVLIDTYLKPFSVRVDLTGRLLY
ncbi:hypothetical protein [Rubrolithibacter danxiaensis]|uniref:hypothetical protein n=1 Tax=Rubrolithibacter danxiaensis TaxID=3390805 RepID=UPI003BF813C6